MPSAITYDDLAVGDYNAADIDYDGGGASGDGGSQDNDRWGWGQTFDVGDVSTIPATWSLIGSSSWVASGTGGFTVNYPAGTALGDILLLAETSTSTTSQSTPTNWTAGLLQTRTSGGTSTTLARFFRQCGGESSVGLTRLGNTIFEVGILGVFRNTGLATSGVPVSALALAASANVNQIDTVSPAEFSTGAYANSIQHNLGITTIGCHRPGVTANIFNTPALTTKVLTQDYPDGLIDCSMYYEVNDSTFGSKTFDVQFDDTSGLNFYSLAARNVLDQGGTEQVDTWQMI